MGGANAEPQNPGSCRPQTKSFYQPWLAKIPEIHSPAGGSSRRESSFCPPPPNSRPPVRFPTHPDGDFHRLIGRCEQVIADGRLLEQVAEDSNWPCSECPGGRATESTTSCQRGRRIEGRMGTPSSVPLGSFDPDANDWNVKPGSPALPIKAGRDEN